MSWSDHHVALNGVFYKLYEDGSSGEHYQARGEPMRPPNSVVVQGANRQDLFQTRTDIAVWSITDWSGGEGQLKFNAQESNRHSILFNVDPFTRPGQLSPGRYAERTQDASGDMSSGFEKWNLAVDGPQGDLVALTPATSAGDYTYKRDWNDVTKQWGAETDLVGTLIPAVTRFDNAAFDGGAMYIYIESDGDLYYFDDARTPKGGKMNSVAFTDPDHVSVREIGDYVYLIRPKGYTVHEIVKSASGSTAYTEVDSGPASYFNDRFDQRFQVARGDNRLYVALPYGNRTEVREITPTTAAAAGFGVELASIPGFHVTSIWWAGGLLYLAGWANGENEAERILLYLIPGGDYGTVGHIRENILEDINFTVHGQDNASDLLSTFFTLWDNDQDPRIYQVDLVEGGMAQIGEITTHSTNAGLEMGPPTVWGGDVFVPILDVNGSPGTYHYIYRLRHDAYTTKTSYAVTPWHDLGLADEKILATLELSCEPLPADWEIKLSYAVNGSDTFTLAGTYSTTSETGTTFQVSDSSSATLFRTAQIKIEFNYTGGGVPTDPPLVNAVQLKAQISKKQNVWSLLLDLKEDLAGSSQRRTSGKKVDNLLALSANDTVFLFEDGYANRRKGDRDSYSVVLDAFNVVLPRQGEGYAAVTLREVVD